MNEIVKLEFIEGEARVSHELIANGMGIKPKNMIELVYQHKADFESFGILPFETEAVSKEVINENPYAKPRKICYLNEQQATLAMTYMRNSEQARAFKMALVRAFYAMKSQLEHGGGDSSALARGFEAVSKSMEVMANAQLQTAESIGVLAQGQSQIIELILQLQSNTPLRSGEAETAKKSISDIQKERLVCINPQFHDNPEERELFTHNIVDILKRYPSGMSQGTLLDKSDWPESTRTRRWLQDGIGAFWNMEIKPGRGYLYFI